MQQLVADAVDDSERDVGAIFGRVDMNTEWPLAERRIDDPDDRIRHGRCIRLRRHDRGERIADSDRKSALQEYLQGRGQPPAEYRVAGESGPDHQKKFEIEVWVGGACMASGQGSTKKEAEQRAAHTALERLERAAPAG